MASDKKKTDGANRSTLLSKAHNGQFYVSHGNPEWDKKGYSEEQLLPLLRGHEILAIVPRCIFSFLALPFLRAHAFTEIRLAMTHSGYK